MKTENHNSHHEHMVYDFRRRFWISVALSIPVLLLSPTIQTLLGLKGVGFIGDQYVRFLFSTIVFFYGGYPFLKGTYRELRSKTPGMMTLVALAITTAYGYSAAVLLGLPGEELLWELVTLVDIMLLGHWLEMRSIMGASRALEELAKLMPSIAHLETENNQTKDVPVSELVLGDRVWVKPGEKIPVDGVVIEGITTVNEAMLTGETKPVEKKEGTDVIGGSINGEGSIVVEIQKVGKDTYLSQIIELVSSAQATKSRTQRLADKAAVFLTLIATFAGVSTLLIWLLFTNESLAFALQRMIAVIVIACPHALGLAIPLVVAVSTTLSAQRGLLVRNRTAFESARNIDAVIFDKTGTLTKGEFGVSDVVAFQGTEKDVLKYAASVESHSEHPIAQAIAKESKDALTVQHFSALPGEGVRGSIGDKLIKVVSPAYLSKKSVAVEDNRVQHLMDEGKTVVFVLVDEKPIGAIAVDDMVRDEAREAIQKLKAMNIEPIMLTGDAKQVAARVSKELEIDTFFAEVLPHQKVEKIKKVQQNGKVVVMVGDGVNDAPALAQANVGVAIGAGTDVAIETADIVLVKSDPRDVVSILLLARMTYGKMIQNLWWASGYNIIALPLAAGVLASYGILLSPAVGAIFMSLSTVIVAINATMLKSSWV